MQHDRFTSQYTSNTKGILWRQVVTTSTNQCFSTRPGTRKIPENPSTNSDIMVRVTLQCSTCVSFSVALFCCVQEDMCNAVLKAFIEYLIDEKEINLVAVYVATLPCVWQIELYARLLKGTELVMV